MTRWRRRRWRQQPGSLDGLIRGRRATQTRFGRRARPIDRKKTSWPPRRAPCQHPAARSRSADGSDRITRRCRPHANLPPPAHHSARFPHPPKREHEQSRSEEMLAATMTPCRATLYAAVLLLASTAAVSGFHLGGDESGLVQGVLAAIRERAEAEEAARFAVAHHNKKQGSALEFTRVLKSKRQVVTGTLHDLVLEAADAGKKSLYRAKVWVKPWEDFKSVVEFRLVGDSDAESESSVASDESSHQAIAKVSLEAGIVQEEARLHTIENEGLSRDFTSSS